MTLLVFIGLFLNSKKESELVVSEKVVVKKKTMFKDVILPAIVAILGLFGVSLIFNIFAAVDPSTPRSSLVFNEKYGISAPSLPGIIVCIVLLGYAYRSYKIIKK